MDAKGVIDKVLSEAQSQVDAIKKESDKKIAVEQASFGEKLTEYKKQTETLAKKAGEEEKAHLLASARMDIAKEYLTDKRAILDKIFEKAKTQLQNMPDEDYRSLMAKLMIEACETGDEEIIVSAKETRINSEFVEQINKKLGADFSGNLRLSDEKQEMAGGFIIRRGKVKTNVSLEIILSEACKELEIELAKGLFAQGE